MGLSDCFGVMRKAAGNDNLPDQQLLDIMSDLEDRRARLGDTSYGRSAEQLAAEQEAAAIIAKRNTLLNLQARLSRFARIEDKATALGKLYGDKKFVYAIQSEIHGINAPVRGGRVSAEGDWRVRANQYIATLDTELERAGLFKAATDPAMQRMAMREIFELSKGDAGKPGVTENKTALDIAKILNRAQTLAKNAMNRAGAWIGDYAGYITRTSHDADKIYAAGFDDWLKFVAPLLDRDKTFEGVADPAEFLRGTFNALTTGVHLTEEGFQGMKDAAFKGPGNLAKRLSQGRVLHFRDADAWLDYNDRFGSATPLETIVRSLDRSARTTAVMSKWGTNPRAEFEADFQRLAEKYRDIDPAAVRALNQARDDLQNRFDWLDGTAERPGWHLGAQIMSSIRTIESMAKLGNVALTHLSTAATKAAELRRNGMSLLSGYADFLQSLVRGRGTGEVREIMDELHAGALGRQEALLNRFTPGDTPFGNIAKLAGWHMKYTLLPYMVNAERAGAEFKLSRFLGARLDQSHDALPVETARELLKRDIGPSEWDLLRRAPDHATAHGMTFLTPSAAAKIPAAQIEAHLRDVGSLRPSQRDLWGINEATTDAAVARKVEAYRQQLALNLNAYYHEASARAIVTPGIAEKAWLLGKTRGGTLHGELMRSIAQFKMWPTAVIRQQLGAEIYGGQSKSAAFRGILALAVGTTALGYIRMAAADISQGKEPRDPADPRTWLAALAQGGGFGILGDFLFGEHDRFGHNVAESILGPVLGGDVADAAAMLGNVEQSMIGPTARKRAAALRATAAETYRTALGHVPFVNLFYARLAIDMAFNWRVQEFMSPGYLKRYEANLRRNTGQRFWISPTAWVHKGVIQPSPAPAQPESSPPAGDASGTVSPSTSAGSPPRGGPISMPHLGG